MFLIRLSCIIILWMLLCSTAEAQTTLAVDINDSTLQWDWTQGTGGAVDGFRCHCGPATGSYNTITDINDPAARSVPVGSIIPGPGTWFCALLAFNMFGQSDFSNEVSFQAGFKPDAPTNLRIVAQ